MARYEEKDLDKCADDAIALSIRVRQENPLATYRHLVAHCGRDPERMAQLMMTLALFVDPDSSTGQLRRLVEIAAVGQAVIAAS
jgi:hypothetical protein